jgi:hypothetical protein
MAKIINILEEKLIHRDPDADEPSWRTRVKRRENDILFLAWVSLEEALRNVFIQITCPDTGFYNK